MLLGAQVAVYSPHTSFDSAPDGINQRLAEALGLSNVQPLRPAAGAGIRREAADDSVNFLSQSLSSSSSRGSERA